MKKRVICIMMTVFMLLPLFAVTVSAENHFFEDFSDDSATDNKTVWVSVSNQCPEKFSLEAENGYLRFRKDVTAENPAPSDQKRFENKLVYPGETSARVWMFDFCEPEENTNNVVNGQWFFTPGLRIWYNVGQGRIRFGSGSDIAEYKYTKGQWYSIMLMISEDYAKAEVYAKPQNGTEWTKFSNDSSPSIVEGNVKNFNYVSLYENSYTNRYLDMKFDNIRFFNGDNVAMAEFNFDGEKVESVAEIADGILEAETVILREDAPTVKSSAMSAFVVFDKEDMMIDFSFKSDLNVCGGVTRFAESLNTDEYFDRIGYVGYYLWDEDLQPYFEGIELY